MTSTVPIEVYEVSSCREWLSAQPGSDEPEIIARGSYGVIYKFNGDMIAKVVQVISESDELLIQSEIAAPQRILSSSTCKSTLCTIISVLRAVQLNEVHNDMRYYVLFMKYIRGQDASQFLDVDSIWQPVPWILNLNTLFADLQGAYESGIVHCDIKPENILYEQSTELMYLSDFGLAVHIESKSDDLEYHPGVAGQAGYFPYNVIVHMRNTYNTDIFAMSVTLFEIFNAEKFFDDSNDENEELQFPLFELDKAGEHTPDPHMYSEFISVYARNVVHFIKSMIYTLQIAPGELQHKLIFSSVALILMANPMSDIIRPSAAFMLDIVQNSDIDFDRIIIAFEQYIPAAQTRTLYNYFIKPPTSEQFAKLYEGMGHTGQLTFDAK